MNFLKNEWSLKMWNITHTPVFLQELEHRADVWFVERMLPTCVKSWVEFTLQRRLREHRRHKAEVFNRWVCAFTKLLNLLWVTQKLIELTCVLCYMVSFRLPCFQAASVHLGVLHVVGTVRETQRGDALWANGMPAADGNHSVTLMKTTVVQLTRDIVFPGSCPRGEMSPAESLGPMATAHTTADQRGRETGGFTPSVPSQTSAQHNDSVEGQQHWDTRQVKQNERCCGRWAVWAVIFYRRWLVD